MLSRGIPRRIVLIALTVAIVTSGTFPAVAQPQETAIIQTPLQSWASLMSDLIDSIDFGFTAIWEKGSGYHDPNGSAESSSAPRDGQRPGDCEGRTCSDRPDLVVPRR